MRKHILVIIIITLLSACSTYQPAAVLATSPYNIPGTEMSLKGDILTITNTYTEASARIQFEVIYYMQGKELGKFDSVGTLLIAGEHQDYKLEIPEGCDSVKVSYAEYKNKGGGYITGTPGVSRSGAVIFTLTK